MRVNDGPSDARPSFDSMEDQHRELASEFVLVGKRTALGPLRLDLAPRYARWLNSAEVRPGVLFSGLLTLEAEEAFVQRASKRSSAFSPEAVYFTIYDLAEVAPIGVTSLEKIDHQHGRAELGIVLGERRGQGHGSEATRLVLDWGFHVLGLRNVLLEAFSWNVAALAAYERAGFREAGRRRGALLSMGRRCDGVLMDAVPDDFESPVLGALVPEPLRR